MRERVEVKICGLVRREDAEAAAALGADYLGVILSEGFRRSVAPARAPELVEGLSAAPVAVLVDEPPRRAEELARTLGARVIQLHGDEPPDVAAELARGGWRVWKSVRARSPADVRRAAERYGAWVEAILVEGFREGVVGGGGVGLDPGAFARLRALVPRPLRSVLAGGLRAETVRAAVDHFAPDVVDVSSGVEREPGRKDAGLVGVFIREARRAGSPAPASPDQGGVGP